MIKVARFVIFPLFTAVVALGEEPPKAVKELLREDQQLAALEAKLVAQLEGFAETKEAAFTADSVPTPSSPSPSPSPSPTPKKIVPEPTVIESPAVEEEEAASAAEAAEPEEATAKASLSTVDSPAPRLQNDGGAILEKRQQKAEKRAERKQARSAADEQLAAQIGELTTVLGELQQGSREIKQALDELRDDVNELGDGVQNIERARWYGEAESQQAEPYLAGLEQPAAGIATVMTEPAVLRAAPSRISARIMSLPLGSQIAVELRRGDWYRVVAPNGFRAWLPADVVSVDYLQ